MDIAALNSSQGGTEVMPGMMHVLENAVSSEHDFSPLLQASLTLRNPMVDLTVPSVMNNVITSQADDIQIKTGDTLPDFFTFLFPDDETASDTESNLMATGASTTMPVAITFPVYSHVHDEKPWQEFDAPPTELPQSEHAMPATTAVSRISAASEQAGNMQQFFSIVDINAFISQAEPTAGPKMPFEQVVEAIQTVDNFGNKPIQFQLSPDSLGKMIVSLTVEAKETRVNIAVENKHALAVLAPLLTRLEKHLEQQNGRPADVTLNMASGGEAHHRSSSESQSQAQQTNAPICIDPTRQEKRNDTQRPMALTAMRFA
jgi:flagellar hook-length control protein FliK